MSSVNQTQGILTEKQFNASPFKNIMSYKDYLDKALKLGSAFTFAHAFALKNAEDTTENINNSVKGYYMEKEAKKAEAEDEYYAALAQYQAMKSGQDAAIRDLNYATNIFGENSTQYSDALKKYNLSDKSLFNSDVNLSVARDRFNFANNSAFKAYLSSRLT